MPTDSKPFLVVATTGRALAASAARAGHPVVVLDFFADRDTHALAGQCRAVMAANAMRFDRRALLAAASALGPPECCAGVVYGSGFEGRTGLLTRLAARRRLYGNDPSVVVTVKDPARFIPLLDRAGIRHPEVRRTAPQDPVGWLVKQPGGAGGTHVRHAGKRRVRAGSYFQRLEPGRVFSALFLADGRRACILGFNEQWTTPARPGRPFLYGGAVSRVTLPATVASDLHVRLDALVAATGLVGLNGLDFLLRDEEWLVLELNPRPTATMELYDPDYPRGLFDWHLRACDGELPAGAALPRAARAHAVVYAALAWQVSEGFTFPDCCRDIPCPGTRFTPGDPICTVHAAESDPETAMAFVRRRQGVLERAIMEEAASAVGA